LRLGGTPRKEKNLCTSPSNQRSFSKQTRSGYELDDRVSAHIHRKAKQAARTALRRGKTRAHLLQAAAAPVGARFLPCPPPHATKKRGLQEAAATAEAFAGCREGGRSRPAPSRTRVTARPLRAHIEGSVHIFLSVCLRERGASGVGSSGNERMAAVSSVDAPLTKERMAPVCLLFNRDVPDDIFLEHVWPAPGQCRRQQFRLDPPRN
jgi:hypothetical protein